MSFGSNLDLCSPSLFVVSMYWVSWNLPSSLLVSDFSCFLAMSREVGPTPSVAIKGMRKRPRSSSDESSYDSDFFRGCRDSPSPTRPGTVQKALKSKKRHHRVVLETPLMRRHVLENKLEELWEDHGVEFKFELSSSDMGVMEFLGGPRPSSSTLPTGNPLKSHRCDEWNRWKALALQVSQRQASGTQPRVRISRLVRHSLPLLCSNRVENLLSL